MVHQYINRFVRTFSELYILTIIAEKGETYPYEIQQILFYDIFTNRLSQMNVLEHIIDLGKKIVFKDSSLTSILKESNTIIPGRDISPQYQSFINFLQKTISSDPDELDQLNKLLTKGQKEIKAEQELIKIWDSKTTNYQVIGDLERENLIEIAREEVQKGRNRKFYKITAEGRKNTLQTIIQLGILYKDLLSKITFFDNPFDIISHDNVSSLLGGLVPAEILDDIVQHSSNEPDMLDHLLIAMFPLLQNDFLIFSLILNENIHIKDLIDSQRLPEQRQAFKKSLIKRLKSFQVRLENKIKELESLS